MYTSQAPSKETIILYSSLTLHENSTASTVVCYVAFGTAEWSFSSETQMLEMLTSHIRRLVPPPFCLETPMCIMVMFLNENLVQSKVFTVHLVTKDTGNVCTSMLRTEPSTKKYMYVDSACSIESEMSQWCWIGLCWFAVHPDCVGYCGTQCLYCSPLEKSVHDEPGRWGDTILSKRSHLRTIGIARALSHVLIGMLVLRVV
jgi:hypothetical protein